MSTQSELSVSDVEAALEEEGKRAREMGEQAMDRRQQAGRILFCLEALAIRHGRAEHVHTPRESIVVMYNEPLFGGYVYSVGNHRESGYSETSNVRHLSRDEALRWLEYWLEEAKA